MGFKLPAYYLNLFVPGLRNGQYAILLIQLSLAFLAVVGLKMMIMDELIVKRNLMIPSFVFLIFISIVSIDPVKLIRVFYRWIRMIFKFDLGHVSKSFSKIPAYFLPNENFNQIIFSILQVIFIFSTIYLVFTLGFKVRRIKILKSSLIIVIILSFIVNVNFPKRDYSQDRWMVHPNNLNLKEINEKIRALPEGSILISPFETEMGTDGIVCLFLSDPLHPLVNTCNIGFARDESHLINRIFQSQNCDKYLVARESQVEYVLLLDYSKNLKAIGCLSLLQRNNLAKIVETFRNQDIQLWRFM